MDGDYEFDGAVLQRFAPGLSNGKIKKQHKDAVLDHVFAVPLENATELRRDVRPQRFPAVMQGSSLRTWTHHSPTQKHDQPTTQATQTTQKKPHQKPQTQHKNHQKTKHPPQKNRRKRPSSLSGVFRVP